MVILMVMKDYDERLWWWKNGGHQCNDDGGTGGWSEAHINDQIPIVCLPTTTIH